MFTSHWFHGFSPNCFRNKLQLCFSSAKIAQKWFVDLGKKLRRTPEENN